MEVLASTAFNLLVQTALSLPRVYWNRDHAKTYEESAPGLISKLSKVRGLRNKLTTEELAQIVEIERKFWDADVEDFKPASQRKETVRPTGAFGDDFLPPIIEEKEITFNDLGSFKLPDTLYAGPRYTGGRFLAEGEKITMKDLAVLPKSDWDLYSRDHDIRFQLIAGVEDEAERERLREIANGIYHLQIYASDDLPQEADEFTKQFHTFTRKIVPIGLTIYQAASIANAIGQETADEVAREIALEVRNERGEIDVWFVDRNGNHRGPPREILVDDGVPAQTSRRIISGLDRNLRFDPTSPSSIRTNILNGMIRSFLQNPFRRDNPFLNSAELRNAFDWNGFEERLIGVADAYAVSDAAGVAAATRLENDIFYNEMLGHRFVDDEGRVINLSVPSDGSFPVRWGQSGNMVVPSDQIDLNRLSQLEALGRMLSSRKFWASSATFLGTQAFYNWALERGYTHFAEEDPVFANKVVEMVPDYQRSHPFFKQLGELIFRNNFSTSIAHQPMTKDEVKQYIDAIELSIEGDPVVDKLKEIYGIVDEVVPEEPQADPEMIGEDKAQDEDFYDAMSDFSDDSIDSIEDIPDALVKPIEEYTTDELFYLLMLLS